MTTEPNSTQTTTLTTQEETQTPTIVTIETPQETGQTGQNQKAKTPYFEIAQEPTTKEWHWLLWSGNGRKMAQSADGYGSEKDIKQAIRLAKLCAAEAKHIAKA